VGLRALYSCEEMCGRGRGKPGDPKLRAASRCSLPDFDPELWDRNADPAAADYAESQASQLQLEDIGFDFETHGCPWGWRLSGFACSVEKYMGRRSVDNPVRAPNLLMLRRMLRDAEPPERLAEAVTLAEAYEDGAFAYYHAARDRA